MTKVYTLHSVVVLISAVLSATVAGQQGFSQAGPEHAILKSAEGTWDAVAKFGPQASKATSTSKVTCSGLWITTEFRGEIEGSTFEGRGIDGYDQDKKKYVSVWVDSMTSSMMTFEGTYDEKSKTMTMFGEGKGPDGKPAKFKSTTSHPDKDHQKFELYLVGSDGKENLMMTIEYTRRK